MEEDKIVFAKTEWIPQLKEIWRECFHDEESYINFFFTNRFRNENMLVWIEEGVPVAMASLLPCMCWKKDGNTMRLIPTRYIYAVGTKPLYEGRGISTSLMSYINNQLKKNQEIGILVPASESLVSFYQKRNFHVAISKKERMEQEGNESDLIASSISNLRILEGKVSKRRYKELRDYWLGVDGYIEWDEDAISYAIQENTFNGGVCFELLCDGESHILLGYKNNEEFIVRETTLSDDNWIKVAMRIAAHFRCHTIIRKEQFFMSTQKKWSQTGYFNLALD
ncbi:MAG: GNAT family N-acetyltransferase [Velocimicrobium sp.]